MSKNIVRPVIPSLVRPVIENFNGFLAYSWGFDLARDGRPVQIKTLKVSKIKAGQWEEIVGLKIDDFSGNNGFIYRPGFSTPLILHTEDFSEQVIIEEPLKPPRAGSDRFGKYHWVWDTKNYLDSCWVKTYDEEES